MMVLKYRAARLEDTDNLVGHVGGTNLVMIGPLECSGLTIDEVDDGFFDRVILR
jgi:hypothetical protein